MLRLTLGGIRLVFATFLVSHGAILYVCVVDGLEVVLCELESGDVAVCKSGVEYGLDALGMQLSLYAVDNIPSYFHISQCRLLQMSCADFEPKLSSSTFRRPPIL